MQRSINALFSVTALTVATCSFAFAINVVGPDGANVGDRAFWANRGDIFNLPLMDAQGKPYLRQTKFYVASTNIISAHVAAKEGRTALRHGLPHVHFMHDYLPEDMVDANRYWDKKSDAPALTKRTAPATDRFNNYASMLHDSGLKVGECWIDDMEK